MRCVGIDIGGSCVKAAMLSEQTVQWTSRSHAYSNPDVPEVEEAIRQACSGTVACAELLALCVPGLVDPADRRLVRSVSLPLLNGLSLEELLRSALGTVPGPIHLITDAIATGYDVYRTRCLQGRLLLLAIGTGVGAAVLDEGVPLFVDGLSPGHFGQMDVSLDGEPPIGPDGGAGSLEAYIAAPALARSYGADIAAMIGSLKGDEPPFRALARAIRIAHAIYRPQHVVLAGGVGIRLGPILGRLRQLVEKNLTGIARPGWTLSLGDSDFHAAIGAARMAIEGRI